jgi:hypothetical protein
MIECRILALGGDWPAAGPGWKIQPFDGAASAPTADLALLPADSPLSEAVVDALALPLIVAVQDGVGPADRWLDRGDAWLLPGDGPDMIGHVARLALGGSGVGGVADASATSQQISALSEQARRIADALAELAARAEAEAPAPIDAALVRRLIRLRRDRDRHFPAELFADPAWDMLLDLAAARMEGADVPVSSLCVAAAVPTTTALRWVRSLSEAGLFVRRTDPADARRTFIGLSDQAFDGVAGWLRRFAGAFQPR